ncbi:relaxase/mobilization nuclease domain-containing protein [Kineococcus rubinsiae]|uniref:relaxase/mobilization nuclease domain-containing protein n=1 Tax=Kineococcus rubinsiae TaxID=2609562 RepID=UPI001AD8B192|nr:hypothetical protein [Kineococcus rubinsiae]
MAGLLVYLAGPGRTNEHTEPHLVAGDQALLAWYGDNELDRDSALAIARHLDRPSKAFGVEIPGGHVWHCSLSLSAEEGMLSDERWQEIAGDFVTAMGFDDNQGTKAACRWAAVRHGVSGNGNDHVHLAVNLVREDGTKASVHNDFKTAQAASRALEVKYGLQRLESVTAQRSTRGFKPAEREAQARARAQSKHERLRATRATETTVPGLPEGLPVGAPVLAWEQLSGAQRQQRIAEQLRAGQPREALALRVRAAATAAADEGEFVRRMRRSGLLVRARFAEGTTDVVTGYSVAARPEHGERPIWYGGGHLGRDLTLPRLRSEWEDTPTGASAAAAEWTAAKRGRRVVAAGRETREVTGQEWAEQDAKLRELVDRLRQVPVDDRDTWATVARQTAGALAAWSTATEAVPGDLAAAAEALSRSAQTYRRTTPPARLGTHAITGLAMLAASASRGGQGPIGQAALISSVLRLTQAVYDHAVVSEQHRQARLLAGETRAQLMRVRAAHSATQHPTPRPGRGASEAASGPVAATATLERPASYAQPEPAAGAQVSAEVQEMLERMNAAFPQAPRPGSPLPSKLADERAKHHTDPAADRGQER